MVQIFSNIYAFGTPEYIRQNVCPILSQYVRIASAITGLRFAVDGQSIDLGAIGIPIDIEMPSQSPLEFACNHVPHMSFLLGFSLTGILCQLGRSKLDYQRMFCGHLH